MTEEVPQKIKRLELTALPLNEMHHHIEWRHRRIEKKSYRIIKKKSHFNVYSEE